MINKYFEKLEVVFADNIKAYIGSISLQPTYAGVLEGIPIEDNIIQYDKNKWEQLVEKLTFISPICQLNNEEKIFHTNVPYVFKDCQKQILPTYQVRMNLNAPEYELPLKGYGTVMDYPTRAEILTYSDMSIVDNHISLCFDVRKWASNILWKDICFPHDPT